LQTVGLRARDRSPEATPSPSPAPAEPEKPGFLRRSVGWLPWVGDGQPAPAKSERGVSLEISAEVDPAEVSLAARRSVDVSVVLRNTGRKTVVLTFPTGQRLELLLRGPGGLILGRWSEDQVFTQETGTLAINPGERVEYRETVSLRAAKAGQPHTIEVSVPGMPDLARTLSLDVRR